MRPRVNGGQKKRMLNENGQQLLYNLVVPKAVPLGTPAALGTHTHTQITHTYLCKVIVIS